MTHTFKVSSVFKRAVDTEIRQRVSCLAVELSQGFDRSDVYVRIRAHDQFESAHSTIENTLTELGLRCFKLVHSSPYVLLFACRLASSTELCSD